MKYNIILLLTFDCKTVYVLVFKQEYNIPNKNVYLVLRYPKEDVEVDISQMYVCLPILIFFLLYL